MIRVTDILDAFPEKELVAWQLRVGKVEAERVSKEALRVGTVTDSIIMAECTKKDIPTYDRKDSPVVNCLQGWQRFKREHPEFVLAITHVQTELIVDELIGHPDFLLLKPTGWGVCDLKCAGQIRPTHWTQVGAYALLRGRLQPNQALPSFLAILRLQKEQPGYEYLELTDSKEILLEMETFRHYLALYEHREHLKDRTLQLKEEVAYGIS